MGIVLLDLSSAFDTVDHPVLINRLSYVGVGGTALQWFHSYLSSRSQSVQIRDTASPSTALNFSVPQGSVLGPHLFNIYTLPLQNIIAKHNLNFHMYADDLQLYFTCSPVQDEVDKCLESLQACICDIRKWMSDSYLKLNNEKTEFLMLGSRQQLRKVSIPPLVVGSAHIPPSDKVKNLGVVFDTAMTLESQISKSVKSANYNLRNIRAIRNYLTPQATEQLTHAFVSSYLDNCNSLFFGLPKYQISKLQKVQNAAARLVTKSKRSDSITPILKRLHWLPVQARIRYKILLITYRALKGLAPDYICTLLKMSSSRSGLRSSSTNSLSCPKTRRNWGDRAFVSAAPRLWNALPSNLKMENTYELFKTKLKTYLVNQTFC